MKTALYIRTVHKSDTEVKEQAENLADYVRGRAGNDTEMVYYIDNGTDGQAADRSALKKLMEEINSYSMVYVSNVNRLARSAAGLFPIVRKFEAAGTKLYAADGSMDDIAWQLGALPYIFEGVI